MVLSPAESATLTAQVAELAQAGLPLAPGLRAMGRELPGGRLARALEDLAQRLEAGASLQSAVEAQGRAFPAHVRGLLASAAAHGHLAQTMADFVADEQDRRDRRRQLWLTMAYPLTLVVGLLAVMLLMSFVFRDIGRLFADFGAELPEATIYSLWLIQKGVWWLAGVAVLVALFLTLAMSVRWPVWPRRLAYLVPLYGPLWQWSALEQFARLMALFLRQEFPLPAALRFVADALRAPDLARACRRMAEQVEAGLPLGECLARQGVFPATLVALADWGQGMPLLAQNFQAAAEMFRRRVEIQMSLIEFALPPGVFLLIAAVVASLTVGLFMPLIRLTQKLC